MGAFIEYAILTKWSCSPGNPKQFKTAGCDACLSVSRYRLMPSIFLGPVAGKKVMHILSLPYIGLASINFAMGGYYLFFYLKKPKIRDHFPFALLCFSVGFYAVFSAGLYNSNSVTEGVFWQRLQLDTIFAISISLIWFTTIFTRNTDNRPAQILVVGFVIVFIVSLFIAPEFSLSPLDPAIKNFNLFDLKVTYYEGRLGLVYQAELLLAITAFIYLLYLFVRYYRKTAYKPLLLIIICLVLYFFGLVNDSLVADLVYRFVYLSEYSFFLIVIAMAYSLMDKFVNLYTAYEVFNIDLEQKVLERTSEIERLNGHLKDLAERDGLTGAYNRRFFNEYFEIEVKRAKNYLEHRAWLDPNE